METAHLRALTRTSERRPFVRESSAGRTRLAHPRKGALSLSHTSFQANEDPTLRLVIYTPV